MKSKNTNLSNDSPVQPDGFSWGRDISPESMAHGRLAIDPAGIPTAYIGYLDKNYYKESYLYPLSADGIATQRRQSRQYVELQSGCLRLAGFLEDDHPYKILEDYRLCLPCRADNTFGVVKATGQLDEPLTRALFGATYDELDDFIDCFYAATHAPSKNEYGQKPARITFSKRRDNHCDLTGAHIPMNFPFVTLNRDTQHFGGHISLHGLYRQVALLCHYFTCSDGTIKGRSFFQNLVDCGAKPEIIIQLRKAAFNHWQVLRNPAEAILALRCG